jgi:hypothetical protein
MLDRLRPALLLIFLLQMGPVPGVMAAPQALGEEPAAATLRSGGTSVTLDGPPAPVPPAVVRLTQVAALRCVALHRAEPEPVPPIIPSIESA